MLPNLPQSTTRLWRALPQLQGPPLARSAGISRKRGFVTGPTVATKITRSRLVPSIPREGCEPRPLPDPSGISSRREGCGPGQAKADQGQTTPLGFRAPSGACLDVPGAVSCSARHGTSWYVVQRRSAIRTPAAALRQRLRLPSPVELVRPRYYTCPTPCRSG